MLTLLELNDDQFSYEMSSLAKKIANFFDDQSRLLSAQWLSVIYRSLMVDSDIEPVTLNTKSDTYEIVQKDLHELIEVVTNDSVETVAKDKDNVEKNPIKRAEIDIIDNFGIDTLSILDEASLCSNDDLFAIVH